jgi:hypothetical protein
VIPKTFSVLGDELFAVARGEVPQSELIDAILDLETPTKIKLLCVAGVSRAPGDRRKAARTVRWLMSQTTSDSELDAACVYAIVRIAGPEAEPDLERAWESRSKRVRDAALGGMAYLGLTDRCSEIMSLFVKALRHGRGSARGIDLSTLSLYLFVCAAAGLIDANDVKASIREGLDRMPLRGGHRRGFIMMLPGIDSETPLAEIEVPELRDPMFE